MERNINSKTVCPQSSPSPPKKETRLESKWKKQLRAYAPLRTNDKQLGGGRKGSDLEKGIVAQGATIRPRNPVSSNGVRKKGGEKSVVAGVD